MRYVLEFTDNAIADIEKHKKSGNTVLLKKLEKIFLELMEHPTTGTGQPEKLKYELTGLYSRRINSKHRLIYSINNDVVSVQVLSAWSHYEDK
jgi:toxin YoeB